MAHMMDRMRPAFLLWITASAAFAASTGQPFYGDPPDEHHPWCVHDPNRPQPPRVAPGPMVAAAPPAGAVVLFDGTPASLTNWEADKPGNVETSWIVKDGVLQCVPRSGYIRTKAPIGDCQLHVEWSAPVPPQGESQGRGNSGIFLMGEFEVQVLDNYENPTYADGFACGMYAVSPPLANALRAPGEWQQIDITFRRPIYQNGKCVDPGCITVFCNGVMTLDHVQLEGPTGHKIRPRPRDFGEAGPLKLQDHGNPVRYRNIWYKPLPPRSAADRAKQGPLGTRETAAKRKQIAAMVRDSAAQLPAKSLDRMLRSAESLVYEADPATLRAVEQFSREFVSSVKTTPPDQIDRRKDEVKRVFTALQYLAQAKVIDSNDASRVELEAIVKAHEWDKH